MSKRQRRLNRTREIQRHRREARRYLGFALAEGVQGIAVWTDERTPPVGVMP